MSHGRSHNNDSKAKNVNTLWCDNNLFWHQSAWALDSLIFFFFSPLKVTAAYFLLCLIGFVCRWSGRCPVTHGGGASSTTGELRGERGIIGTRLFTSPETCRDNLREGMRNEIEGDLREKEWLSVESQSVCEKQLNHGEGQWRTDSRRTGARSLGLVGTIWIESDVT